MTYPTFLLRQVQANTMSRRPRLFHMLHALELMQTYPFVFTALKLTMETLLMYSSAELLFCFVLNLTNSMCALRTDTITCTAELVMMYFFSFVFQLS